MQPDHVVPVIPVSDLPKAVSYYRDVLGFQQRFEYGGFYVGMQLGKVHLHLTAKGRSTPGTASVYVFADEVDDYYQQVVAKGAKVSDPPNSYDYGMRDFACLDPDGNQISFGCPHDERQ